MERYIYIYRERERDFDLNDFLADKIISCAMFVTVRGYIL